MECDRKDALSFNCDAMLHLYCGVVMAADTLAALHNVLPTHTLPVASSVMANALIFHPRQRPTCSLAYARKSYLKVSQTSKENLCPSFLLGNHAN
jgi:hypothetical protein